METVRKYPAMILAGVGLFFYTFGCTAVDIGLERDSELVREAEFTEADEARVEAFSKYAWGSALEMEGEVARETYEKYYISALKAMPESRVLFQRIVRSWLEHEDYERILEVLTPIAYENPGVLHLQAFVSAALAKLSDLEDILPMEFAYYTRMGREFLELDADQKAHFYLSRAHQQRRDVLYVRVLLAHTKLRLGRYQEAYRILEAVEEPIPQVNLLRSQAVLEQGKPEKARELAQKAWDQVKEDEEDAFLTPDFYLYQASIFDKLGDLERTLELAELALEADPESAMVQNFLGYILADHGLELERAEKLISRAIESEPESVAIRDSLAWVYYRQERYEEALREINLTLNQAEKRGVEDDVIYDHAGDIYAANGYQRLAVYYWRRAILQESDEEEKLNEKIQRFLNQP